ncbi:GPR1/FUN34/yaaH family-domain-containing protein [Cladochytrium replicatum]|nr:GPR1/FUN34/yaaH family-domain-containing protein [Cladochytrium replicatum]
MSVSTTHTHNEGHDHEESEITYTPPQKRTHRSHVIPVHPYVPPPPPPPRIANPSPLGLFAFGITTIMLNFRNASVSERAFIDIVVCYGIFFGGFVQICAGILEFFCNNLFGATAFTSYGAFWLGFSLWDILASTGVLKGPTVIVAGRAVLFATWGFFSLLLFIPTLYMNRAMCTIFGSLVILFALLIGGIYNENCEIAAGVVGIFCGGMAIYTAYAVLLKELWGSRSPLPLGVFVDKGEVRRKRSDEEEAAALSPDVLQVQVKG